MNMPGVSREPTPSRGRLAGFGVGGIEFGADSFENGCGIGKLPGLFLGIDLFAVDSDFENAAAHGNERERTDILF
jgi:hypothetical protein